MKKNEANQEKTKKLNDAKDEALKARMRKVFKREGR